MNAAYNPTGSTGDFFQVPPASGLIALDPSLNVDTLKTSDTGNSGANELALAVAQVAGKSFSTGSGDLITGTIGQFYNKSVTSLGQSISGLDSRLTDQGAVEAMVRSQRDSISAVSLDEEMADLLKFQRAYQASARVINVMDDLLDVVVNQLGR